ncbi:MAG: gliding motility-associated C-terminal domain-containing protein [Cyclobacteriaceae bacterium]|nr:gliding motility-associated C-terminal domain-containing protein [Cyclobacteriaceae bacterium]
MKTFWLVLLIWLPAQAVASHIVGGEFELVHVAGSTYKLRLILYFDSINGLPGAKDGSVSVAIYRKRDHALIRSSVFLPLLSETRVPYTQIECTNGELVTYRLVYETTVTLSESTYNDPRGYYVTWQRCCRNYAIDNIFSQNPNLGPNYAGQTFYLEFPPVVKDGQPFRNSSPRLFPPLSDYACPGRFYYVDFGGTDDDGDSLVYSLAEPLNTLAADALPPGNVPRPGPYPPVRWKSGFGPANVMGGAPGLAISRDGLLTVTPTLQGLFVFAVKCEEYRQGEKIGELRRDFQMLVQDACPVAEPPVIAGKRAADVAFLFRDRMNVTFAPNTPDAERCIQVRVSDPDASKADDNFTERIRLRVVPLGFRARDLSSVTIGPQSTAILQNGSTREFTICFPECSFVPGGAYEIGVIAQDDACTLPLSDTLRVRVTVLLPPNQKPQFTPDVVATVGEQAEVIRWPWSVTDPDGDPLVFASLPTNFLPDTVGMTLRITNQQNGRLEGVLEWLPQCDVYNFSRQNSFELTYLANDLDRCDINLADTLTFRLRIELPNNVAPIIDSDLRADASDRAVLDVERKINESLVFTVTGSDANNDRLVLDVKGKDFALADYGMAFSRAEGNGRISSPFRWDIRCGNVNLTRRDTFELQFIVVDNVNKCRFYKADTLDVKVKVKPPDNQLPQLTLEAEPGGGVLSPNLSYTLGEPIRFRLRGRDADVFPQPDRLSLTMAEGTGNVEPRGFVFEPATGQTEVSSLFSWTPDCSVFEKGVYENHYEFLFRVEDDKCFRAAADSIRVQVVLKDVDGSDAGFLPPNVITPNADGRNDYFAMEGFDPGEEGESYDDRVNLPKDNCTSRFEEVQIFNRWGNVVFRSRQRNFRWYAANQPVGVYYYFLKYTSKEYKGSLSVRY